MSQPKESEVLVNVPENYKKLESYFLERRKKFGIAIVAVLAVIGSYLVFKYVYVANQEEEAQSQIWKAQDYFKNDSLTLALNGDGNYPGFLKIIDNYAFTPAANLSHFYAGICYLKLGDYKKAIKYLEDYDRVDVEVGGLALSALGDAYMELGEKDKGIKYYKKAAGHDANEFLTPIYLLKAGRALEMDNKPEDAKKMYEELREEFPKSAEARDIERYLARVNGKIKE